MIFFDTMLLNCIYSAFSCTYFEWGKVLWNSLGPHALWEWHVGYYSPWRHPSSAKSGAMPSLIHNSKSNSRPHLLLVTSRGYLWAKWVQPRHLFCRLSGCLAQLRSVGHVERITHGESSLLYPSMDLNLLKEGGVSHTNVPLAYYVKQSPVQSRVEYVS